MSTNKKLEIILLILALFIYISCDINIHIIPHVYFIFKTVLLSLTNNKEMTFIINKIYYFKIWYEKLPSQENPK